MDEPEPANCNETISIEVGKVFENENATKAYIESYNKANYTDFTVAVNNKKMLVYLCKFGRKRKPTCSDSRPKQRYNNIGCLAKINLYKSQKEGIESLKVTQVNLAHNHLISKEAYDAQHAFLTGEEVELVKDLGGANLKPSQIQNILMKKADKRISCQKLKNLISKICPSENENDTREAFNSFLEKIDNDGGIIEWEDDPDCSMKSLFITTNKMKSAYSAARPTVVQLDTSFNFEQARYKVAAFCYLDPNTNKTEIAAYAILSQETASSFEFSLRNFSRLSDVTDLIFMVDKDFTEIETIRKVCPSSTVLLCIFHVLKFNRNLISTALARQEVKNEIYKQFQKVLLSRSETKFEQENECFLKLVDGVEVKSGKNYVQLKSYYMKNWYSCKDMWVKCFRLHLPLHGDNTTNRAESTFSTLKRSLADAFVTVPKTIHGLRHLVEFADKRLLERYAAGRIKRLVIFHSDENIRLLNEEASYELNERGCRLFNESLDKMYSRIEKLKKVTTGVLESHSNGSEKEFVTSVTSCNCTFVVNHQAPCLHLLFLRKLTGSSSNNDIRMFDKSLFHARYHRKELMQVFTTEEMCPDDDGEVNNNDDIDILSVLEDDDDSENRSMDESTDKKMSDIYKFKTIMPLAMSIANLAALHNTKKFLEIKGELQVVEQRIRRGIRIYPTKTLDCEYLSKEVQVDSVEIENIAEEYDRSKRDLNDLHINDQHLEEQEHVAAITVGKFSRLKFKEHVMMKGRPRKKKGKQVTFNKTAIDRKSKPSTSKNRIPDFINDEEDEDELSDISDKENSQPEIVDKV